MWKLNRIYAENVCAFRELDYKLDQNVTTLIFGDNRDNDSQRSNGAGKSALIECIAIGISGSPLRKIKNEEIINDQADDCFIHLEFMNDSSNELFAIERQLFRKGPAIVNCSIERGGSRVTTDEAVQSSVENYNHYILEKLGISKEELFNNFILSKHKYVNFLSSSDREKKEIINQFSNGIIVDEALEKLASDKTPVEKRLREAELELAGFDGRIKLLTEQISHEEGSLAQKAESKQKRIEDVNKKIEVGYSLISLKKAELKELKISKELLSAADQKLQEEENGNTGLECSLEKIRSALSPFDLKIPDWDKIFRTKNEELEECEMKREELDTVLLTAENHTQELQKEFTKLLNEQQLFCSNYHSRMKSLDDSLSNLAKDFNANTQKTKEQRDKRQIIYNQIESLKNQIAGVISCPKCNHQFLLSDDSFSADEAKVTLSIKENELKSVNDLVAELDKAYFSLEATEKRIKGEKRNLESENTNWLERVNHANRNIYQDLKQADAIKVKHKELELSISLLQKEVDNIRQQVFDDAFSLVDGLFRKYDRDAKVLQDETASLTGSIESLKDMLAELDSTSPSDMLTNLRASLKDFRNKEAGMLKIMKAIERELSRLNEQEEYFLQFKSYLANTKINALNEITNEFLKSIGSDIRLRLSGYTLLKTGKIREKISASLERGGTDMGSFGKFSEGEAARVNLATILAMHKLINIHCESDKGLDLLVLDEILEAVDEAGLHQMFSALNQMGLTTWVVSHGNVAESYPYKLIVCKENGISKIEL